MMEAERILAHPPHPPSEVEWEDLLLRLEVMTKAVRIAAEEPADGVDALEVVRALVGREIAARDFLERAAGEPSSAPAEPTPGSGPIQQEVERFVRLRARNFAMMQRRGIDVWDWRAEVAEGRPATVYQFLTELVHRDVEALARLRGAPAGGAA